MGPRALQYYTLVIVPYQHSTLRPSRVQEPINPCALCGVSSKAMTVQDYRLGRLTGRFRDDTLKGLADKTLIRNSLTSRVGFHGLK